jgi:tetratricopeptide (TPR) repeat protein
MNRNLPEGRHVFQPPPDQKRSHALTLLGLVLLMFFLGSLGLLGLHYLRLPPANQVASAPKPPAEQKILPPRPAEKTPQQPGVAMDAALPAQETALTQQRAMDALGEYLKVKDELDRKGGIHWGGGDYQSALRNGSAAEGLLMQKEFAKAATGFKQATGLFHQLLLKSDKALGRTLAGGTAALEAGNGEGAIQLFQIALMIDPDNQEAEHLLQRAQKLEQVKQEIDKGDLFEKEGNYSAARDAYQKALGLDSESARARKALARVQEKLHHLRFRQLMSQGMAAFHSQQLRQAQQSFLEAQRLKPDAHEVKDALLQVDSAIRLKKIENLQRKALAAEKTENWDHATAFYRQVLSIDGNIQFAVQGLERSQTRQQYSNHMQHLLNHASILTTDRGLKEAQQLLNEAEAHEAAGPLYRQQLSKLKESIHIYQTPVKLTITSDSATHVAVYKIGKLGVFQQKALSVRPGTYTIVGSRNGFKDVRYQLNVAPGADAVRINVVCREVI